MYEHSASQMQEVRKPCGESGMVAKTYDKMHHIHYTSYGMTRMGSWYKIWETLVRHGSIVIEVKSEVGVTFIKDM